MKTLSQQPWITVVDFMVRYPDSPEEAKDLGRVLFLLRDSVIEHRWFTNMHRVSDLLHANGWGHVYGEMPMTILQRLNEMVYGDEE